MTTLRRAISQLTLSLYGVGVMVGAGIYVLVGKVAAVVGPGVWLAMVLAALAALPTGASYAELSSRYPKSAGEAVFAERAFGRPTLSFVVGFLIFASGIASIAAVSHGFAHYFCELSGWSADRKPALIVGFLAALTVVNHRGIEASSWLNVVCTFVSVGALLVIVAAGLPHWGSVELLAVQSSSGAEGFGALIAGCALAFYAYIGFEDICNIAEEVKDPERAVPRAIFVSVGVTALLYAAVGITVVSVVSPAELARSDVPLALVWATLFSPASTHWLSLVAIFAVTNTALFNLIMASRILYGMGRNGLVPAQLAYVHPRRQTPTAGVATAFVLSVAAALTGFLQVLAEATATIILIAFFCVNSSLLVVRKKGVPPDDPSKPYFRVPIVVPMLGQATTGYLALQFSIGAYARAAALMGVGVLLFAIRGRAVPR